ncbi:hypothetical protein G6F42_006778 [Rhizopus arrhizus]|nr:hypothetical protein G6F42_006778 [Rhizopus arrhizus]
MAVKLLDLERDYLDRLNGVESLLSKRVNDHNPDYQALLESTRELIEFHKEYDKTEQTERVYSNYFNHFIYNLNDKEIELLKAPSRQLNCFKSFFNQVLDSSSLLSQANRLFDSLLKLVLNLDTSNVVDIITKEPITHYQLDTISKIVFNHTFHCIEIKKEVQLVLTESFLSIFDPNGLLFQSLSFDILRIRFTSNEYQLQLSIDQKRTLTFETTKKMSELWIGSNLSNHWLSLQETINKKKTDDLFCYFQDPSGEISSSENILMQTPPIVQHVNVSKPLPSINQSTNNLMTNEITKKKSFIRSVLSAVSSPSGSLKKSNSNSLLSTNNRQSSLPNRQTSLPNRQSSLVDSLQPNRPDSSLHHQSSNSSFSSTYSSLNTPPLSRSCSPGSSTPASQLQMTTSSSFSSSEDLNQTIPAPGSPNINNTIKRVLYRDDQCQLFHWKDESWYATEQSSVLEIRQTFGNRTCVTIHHSTGQMYLNVWISSADLSIQRASDTDINLTLLQTIEENYLIHCVTKEDANRLENMLKEVNGKEEEEEETNKMIELTQDDLLKSLNLVLECKCKLYLQSSSAKWHSFGSAHLKVSQHSKTKKMHLAVESHKKLLVSAMVSSRNVERLGPKSISFLFTNEKTSVVYMIKLREESMGDKMIEYVKEKNAENGW